MGESKLGTAYVAIRATLDELEGDLSKARDTIEKNLSGTMEEVGKKLLGIGAGLTAGLTLPIVGVGAAVLDLGTQFDESMDTIRTATGATGDDLTGLGDDVKAVFGAIPTDVATATQAVAELNARTGQTGPVLQELAQAEIELARVTGGELGSQIANTTRLFGDWGIAVSDQVPALDKLLRTHQATGIEVDTLAAKLVQFGAPLRQMGFDFETSAALIGKFEKEGVNTELVLGSLRIALGKFADAGIEPREGLRQLIEAIKNTGSTAEANSLAIQAFGARAGPDMAAAIREGRFDVEALYATIAGGTETVLGAAADTNDFAEKLTVLKNQAALAALPLGVSLFQAINNLMPMFQSIIGFVAGLAEKFSQLPTGVQTAIVAFLAIAAAVGPVLTTIGGIITAVSAIAPVFAGIGAAVGAAAAAIGSALLPIIAIIAAIVLAVVAFKAAWDTNFLGIRDILQEVGTAISTTFQGIQEIVGGVMAFLRGEMSLADLGATINTALAGIGEAWRTAWENIGRVVAEVWPRVLEAIGAALEAIKEFLISKLAEFLAPIFGSMENARTVIENAWNAISTFLSNVWTGIQVVAGAAWETIKGVITTAVEGLRTSLGAVFQLLSGDIGGAWTTLQTGTATAWETIKGTVITVATGIAPALAPVWENIKTGASTAWTSLQTVAGTLWTGIVTTITSVWEGLQTAASTVWAAISTTIETVVGGIKTIVLGIFGELVTAAAELFGKILAAIGGGAGAGGGVDLGGLLNLAALRQTLADIVTAVQEMRISVETELTALPAAFESAWTAIQSGVTAGWAGITGAVETAAAAIQPAIVAALADAGSWLDEAWQDMAAGVADGWKAITKEVEEQAEGIKEAIETATTDADTWLDETWTDLTESVTAGWKDINETATTEAKGLARSIQDGIAAGMAEARPLEAVEQWARDLALVLSDAAKDARDYASDVAWSIADGFYNGMAAANPWGAFEQLYRDVISILGDLASDAYGSGRAVGQAVADGIYASIDAAVAAAEALAQAVSDVLPSSDAKRGPLDHLMAQGRALPETLAKGIATGQRLLEGATWRLVEPLPELVMAGSRGNGQAAGGGQVTLNMNIARVGDDVDVEVMAYRVAEVLQWRSR